MTREERRRHRDRRLRDAMARHGIVYPGVTLQMARKVNRELGHMPLSRACALLEKESGGGANVWGHDRDGRGCIPPCGGPVTRESYASYLKRRRSDKRQQGCGPTQLTYHALQDRADRLGGCWRPKVNMYVGFAHLADNINRNGVHAGMRIYNGSGPAAERYARDLRAREARWLRILETALATERAPAPGPAVRVIARGQKGHAVTVMTRRLSYLSSPATGRRYLDGKRTLFDKESELALRRFQGEHGLKVSGRFGPRTAAVLARAVRAEKKRRSAAGASPGKAPAPTAKEPDSVELLARLEQLDVRGDRVREALIARGRRLERALGREQELRGEVERRSASVAHGGAVATAARAVVPVPPVSTRQPPRLLEDLLVQVRSGVREELERERKERMSVDEELRALIAGDSARVKPAGLGNATAGGNGKPSGEPEAPPPDSSRPADAAPAETAPAETARVQPGLNELIARLVELDEEDDRIRGLVARRYAELETAVARARRRRLETEAAPADDATVPPPAAGTEAVSALQRSLNHFTTKYLRGVAPLRVTGVKDPATARRIKAAKHYLGYGPDSDSSVKPAFVRRLRDPHSREHSGKELLARGARRRRAQRARHARAQTAALQRSLNHFTTKYLRGVAPLAVDGSKGPETDRRVKAAKFYLGYGARRDATVKPEFVRRLRHPHSRRYGNADMLKRAARRRKAQRVRFAQTGTDVRGGVARPLATDPGAGSAFNLRDPEGAPDGNGVRFHSAKDWFAPGGSKVRAPVGGRITEVKPSNGNTGQIFGGVVKIQAADGKLWVFRHVVPRVRVGERVKPGELIATVTPWKGGSSHTHIEVWRSPSPVYKHWHMIDPMVFFKPFVGTRLPGS